MMFFLQQVEKMIELAKLDPDIATYGVMAMGCVTHQQAKEFREMLIGKGVRFVSSIFPYHLLQFSCVFFLAWRTFYFCSFHFYDFLFE